MKNYININQIPMKFFLTLIVSLFTVLSYSQTPVKIPQGLQHSNDNINQDDWNLVDYQFKVDEIQTKIDYINSSPEETEKANATNWFNDAYELLKSAKFERDTHIEKYAYKKIDGFPQRVNTGDKIHDDNLFEQQITDWIHAHPLTQKDHGQ